MKPAVSSVQATGTDGEQCLVEALSLSFPHARQLRCFRHLQKNIEKHLREKEFSSNSIKEYVHDIFGYTYPDGTYHEGLVDCCSTEEYDKLLSSLEDNWNQREQQVFLTGRVISHNFFLGSHSTRQKSSENTLCDL